MKWDDLIKNITPISRENTCVVLNYVTEIHFLLRLLKKTIDLKKAIDWLNKDDDYRQWSKPLYLFLG